MTLALLFGAALLAGFVDSIAGGGGLITMPALLLAGVSPVAAIGTNKSQAIFGTSIAATTLVRRGLISPREIRPAFIRSMIGSAIGAVLVQQINTALFDFIVPIVVGLIGAYFLFAPSPGETDTAARLTPSTYRNTAVPAIGFYDGFFGPGAGAFFALSGVTLRGLGIVEATASAKALNLASNMAALIVFIIGGQIIWAATAVMMGGQFIGASVGTRVMIAGGTRVIRPLVVVVSAAMLIKWILG